MLKPTLLSYWTNNIGETEYGRVAWNWSLRPSTSEYLDSQLLMRNFDKRNNPGNDLANDINLSNKDLIEHMYLVNHDAKSVDITFSRWGTFF
jgi:hypothetical protein